MTPTTAQLSCSEQKESKDNNDNITSISVSLFPFGTVIAPIKTIYNI